jgi:DMSO/TMAO reductase YedYZ molybdopterin-dependent catalytic subunit
MSFSRREWLGLALATPALAGKRQLGRSPVISVQDFEQYPALLTPAADFFVRNHFDIPAIDRGAWRLALSGHVKRATALSLPELQSFPKHEITCVTECAGNGVGVGAVGCARWSGVRLREVLEACGIDPAARFLRTTGADRGHEPDAPEVQYARSVSLEDALRPETILALEMHGRPLEAEHGAPARLVAAGRYGMDSVKWIERIDLLDKPDDSFFMARRFRRVVGGVAGDPVGKIAVKSIIVKPAQSAAIRGAQMSGGYAWAGADRIVGVEVRIDDGVWIPAELIERAGDLAWVSWRAPMENLSAGTHTIEARAITVSGQVQPNMHDANREDEYELNQVQRVHFLWRP